MRKITFRGKRTDNGQWVEGDLIQSTENQFSIWPKQCETLLGSYEVDPSTVGQFTGKTDVKEKDIYEGDKMQIGNKASTVYIVIWNELLNGWELSNKKGTRTYFPVPPFGKVIGTIHDKTP